MIVPNDFISLTQWSCGFEHDISINKFGEIVWMVSTSKKTAKPFRFWAQPNDYIVSCIELGDSVYSLTYLQRGNVSKSEYHEIGLIEFNRLQLSNSTLYSSLVYAYQDTESSVDTANRFSDIIAGFQWDEHLFSSNNITTGTNWDLKGNWIVMADYDTRGFDVSHYTNKPLMSFIPSSPDLFTTDFIGNLTSSREICSFLPELSVLKPNQFSS